MVRLATQIAAIVVVTVLCGSAWNVVAFKDEGGERKLHFNFSGARLRFGADATRYPGATECATGKKPAVDEVAPPPVDGAGSGESGEPGVTGGDAGAPDAAGGTRTDQGTAEASPLVKEPKIVKGLPHIGLEEATALWKQETRFVDARKAEAYEAGHIPGAVNIPAWDADIAERIQALAEEDGTAAPVVVYCNESEECEDSHIVANQMKLFDFLDLSVYEGGFPGWMRAGMPVAEGDAPGDVSGDVSGDGEPTPGASENGGGE